MKSTRRMRSFSWKRGIVVASKGVISNRIGATHVDVSCKKLFAQGSFREKGDGKRDELKRGRATRRRRFQAASR